MLCPLTNPIQHSVGAALNKSPVISHFVALDRCQEVKLSLAGAQILCNRLVWFDNKGNALKRISQAQAYDFPCQVCIHLYIWAYNVCVHTQKLL